ncbi:MAG: molybdate transport system permease protein [Actinomycetota bacterium]|nr:molybdate transport system permease protein [Actinomycetota bacterium]
MTDVAADIAADDAQRAAGARRRSPRVPYALFVPAAVGILFLLLPLVGLLVRTPWRQLPELISGTAVRTALRLSLETATAATVIAIALGVPIAWVLARVTFPGRTLLRALITLPLVLPPVAGGIALLMAYGRRGVVGGWMFKAFGVSLPFTTAAVIVAETFVAMPFLIVSVEGSLRGLDVRYDQAAATLGASRWFTFRHVTLPMLAPGIAAGAVLCWARALGEFGATITFAGSYPGTTQTMPVRVYLALQDDPNAAIALSFLLLVVSVAILAGLRDRWLRPAT